jgi:hypothetical protein
MGDVKRMQEVEERARNKKIDFIKDKAPEIFLASIFSGLNNPNAHDAVDMANQLFDAIENKIRKIACGEDR